MSAEESQVEATKGKRAAAVHALGYVREGMKLGLGTGSTAEIFVALLAERVSAGLGVICVPTSERTAAQARASGIRLAAFDDQPRLDLTIDGADECDPHLRLIKGGGGALLREKIVAAASRRMVVIADRSKAKPVLGGFPLPVEVNKFGLAATRLAVEAAVARASSGARVALRAGADGTPFQTDGGHLILDCHLGRIDAPEQLGCALHAIPGVVEHGLFIGLATTIILAGADGDVTILGQPQA